MKKLFKSIGLLLLLVFIIFTYYTLPIITGYGAKVMCSDVFISGRDPKDIMSQDLGIFPFKFATYKVNRKDKSVIATFFGLASNKAIYIPGKGSTLLKGISESELRALFAKNKIASFPALSPLPWPSGDSIINAIPSFINKTLLDSTIEYCFKTPGRGKSTRAVLVVYKGNIIGERYASGYGKLSMITGWSMSKGITNALLGILVNKNKLDINSKTIFPEWSQDARSNITVADLMHMSSGLQWSEFYEGPSDVNRMLFYSKDMGTYALNKPAVKKPGSYFYYSSGTANLLSLKIRKIIGEDIFQTLPYTELFNKIGMYHTLMESDPTGTFVGSSYCYATARDWARFGLLYLNDGFWNGERLLPKGWVHFSTATSKERNDSRWGKYGALWWVNAGDPQNQKNRRYPDVPEDCYSAMGFEGQSVWIIPSKQLVIVRLSCEHDHLLDGNKFLSEIIKSVE